jgi:hypothetical protein
MDPSGKAIFAAKSKRSGADGSIVSSIGGPTLLFDIRNSPVLKKSPQSRRSDQLIVGFARDPATSFYPHRTSRVRDKLARSKLVVVFRAKRRRWSEYDEIRQEKALLPALRDRCAQDADQLTGVQEQLRLCRHEMASWLNPT